MKYLFLVQGEGRGHMTQAIELARILEKFGHEVVHTFIGESKRRKIPAYFYQKIPSEIESIKSPNFILSKDNKSLNLWKSITFNSKYLGTYKRSLDLIHQKVKQIRPDAIINFYDFIGGFYFRFYKPKNVKHVCVGRQFLTLHPDYPYASDREVEKKLYLLNNKLTSQCCDKYLALSFRPYEPRRIGNMVVMPPLIKEETRNAKIVQEDFILGYMVNDGYAEDVIAQHKNMPDLKLHCFWDRKGMPVTYSPHEHLTFHLIDNHLFTNYMTRCKGYISTAGFESICEAMYLGKPTLMIPVASQYEQACNAIDGELSGAGEKATSFNISQLINVIDNYQTPANFKQWVNQAEVFFNEELTNL